MEAERWELKLLEEAMEEFWDNFFPHRRDLRAFALTQSHRFPESFIAAFVKLLDCVDWKRLLDPGYEAARESMLQLALSCVDPNEIIALEKQLKRRKEKERKKIACTPLWELGSIESSVAGFWGLFGEGRSDLRAYAASQAPTLPKSFTYKFIKRLDRAGWSHRTDPHYEVAVKIMGRLARSFAKGPGLEGAFSDIEAKHEEDKARKEAEKNEAEEREEAERKKAETRLKRLAESEAEKLKKKKEKEEREAFNKTDKERKRREREKNESSRVGAKALGI